MYDAPRMSTPSLSGCPACGSPRPRDFVETHFDKIGAETYTLSRCGGCGVVSSEPRRAVGADWYVKASPIRDLERRSPPDNDWRFRQFFSDGLPAGRLLDVGCGDGGFLSLARRKGFEAVGFDYDERVVAQARARGLDDVHAMEFSKFCAGRKPGEFDVATMFDVLEHTPEPAWFFGEVKRLLKPGGCVAITLPNALRPIPWGREEHDFPPHHYTRWTPDAMRGFLESQGFDIVRQDAGVLKTRYLADHFFFYRVMPPLLKAVKRIVFRRGGGADGAPLSELYAKTGGEKAGALGDKVRRQRLVNAARAAFWIFSAPVWLALRAYYAAREPRSGDCLYTLARRRA